MAVTVRFKSKVNNGNNLPLKSLLVAIFFVALSIMEIWSYGSGLFYVDEIIGIVSAVYLAVFIKKIERRDAITIVILFAVVLLGLLSNIVSGLAYSVFSILIDVVTETKTLFALFALKYFLDSKEKQVAIDLLTPFSKLFVLSTFVFSLLNLVVDIGMRGEARYGLPSFRFIYIFNYQYIAVYMLVFGVLVCNSRMSKLKKRRYFVLALIPLLLALKSPSTMFAIIFVFLSFYFKKHKKISAPIILLGALAILIAGRYQIETYLIDEESPRRLFIKYSIKTANDYFPLGSGFATFGCDQAKEHYAQLYYRYGFDKIWGMTPDLPAFLLDTFWPTLLGQFGWFGFLGYIAIFVRLFTTFNNKNSDRLRRALLYAIFLQYMIQSLGTPILANSAGMIGFVSLALFSLDNDAVVHKKLKIKFRTK